MVSINNIAPMDVFRGAVTAGRITERVHPTFPELSIFNYSRDTQYANDWDLITLSSRGLIVNTVTEEIVARPFAKFFNYGDNANVGELDYSGRIEVMDKADGALGILYPTPDGTYAVSTRGSMDSIPARHASEVYAEKYEGKWNLNPNHTYLFEIIYPGWPIVLNYGDMDDLILLGAIDNATGVSVPWADILATGWNGPVVERFEYSDFTAVLADSKLDQEGKEGFVIHFLDADKRVKVKFADYLRLHKIVFGVTPLRVWEMLSSGDSLDAWVKNVPDEFASDVNRVASEMTEKHAILMREATTLHMKITSILPEGYSRKDLAMAAKEHAVSGLVPDSFAFSSVMSIEAGRPESVNAKAWELVRPHGMERM
jgi:RNA ligase